MANTNYTLREAMDTIKTYLENASDKVGAYKKEPTGLQKNEMGDDFKNPDVKQPHDLGSNNDGVKTTFKSGDVEDSAKVSVTKESTLAAMNEVYEAAVAGQLSDEERDLFISILK